MTGTDAPRARGVVALDRRGVVGGVERARLAATLGCLLAIERRARSLTQRGLAELAGVSRRTVEDLEAGRARPSVNMLWRLGQGLRIGFDERAVATVAMRLETAAGDSLRDFARRPHVARERLRRELLAEWRGRPPVHPADSLAAVTVAELLAGARS